LPYPDGLIDAVWCANVTQYLSDKELTMALDEFHRVVRPGGIVVIKDWDIPSLNFWPPGPQLMWHHYEALYKAGEARTRQMFRAYELPAWLRSANFVNVNVETTLTERFQPLRPTDIAFLKPVLKFFARRAQEYDLPASDLAIWQQLGNVDSPDSVLNDPNFYFREGHILATGYVPVN
jgi:SAM-dependent methyltransferase